MTLIPKITLVIAGLYFWAITAFVARPSGVTQLFLVLLTLGFVVFFIIGFVRILTQWRHEGWRSFLPFGACVLVLLLAPQLGFAIRQFKFQRCLPHYQSVIHQIESGSIPVTAELRHLPEVVDSSLAYGVLAQRSSNGVLTVEF